MSKTEIIEEYVANKLEKIGKKKSETREFIEWCIIVIIGLRLLIIIIAVIVATVKGILEAFTI